VSTPGNTRAGAIARAFLDAFARKDIDAALALLAEDVVWHVDGATEVPSAGLLQGKARIKAWIAQFPDAFEPRGFRTAPIIDGGGEAIVSGWFRYLVRPTGRTVEGDFSMRFRVRDGLILHYQIFEDSLALAQAFEADVDWPPGRQRIRVNDTVYEYDDVGDGPVVLVLSGRTRSARYVRSLKARRRCVSIDLSPGDRPARDVAGDLALLIREKSWQPVTVVAHGNSSTVATELITRHPTLAQGESSFRDRAAG